MPSNSIQYLGMKKPTPRQLRALRRAQEIPQTAVAKTLGRSQGHVAKYELGKAKLTREEERRLADLLGAPYGEDDGE